jgi:hypothetical protein
MVGNCKKAIQGINKIRPLFPEIYFYLPAEHDELIQILYNNKQLTEKQILDGDLELVRQSDGWFFYRFDKSRGSEVERLEAMRIGLVDCNENDIVFDISKASYTVLRKRFQPIVESAIKRFRRKL